MTTHASRAPRRSVKFLSVAEKIEELEKENYDDVQAADVILFPPDDNVSDGDSGDEDCNDPDRISRSQLRARGELQVTESNNADCFDAENDESPPAKKQKSSKRHVKNLEWNKGDLPERASNQTNLPSGQNFFVSDSPAAKLTKDNHPLDFLLAFLNGEVIDTIVNNSVRYGSVCLKHSFTLSRDEMYVFLGILYLSGYVPLPRRRMFWENSDDTQNKAVTGAMRRAKFEEIFRFLHVCDNEKLEPNDKYAKVRPLLVDLNKLFLENAPDDTEVSVDESMIPYFGRHSCKQFLKLKPVRFGYKAWVVAEKGGYCLNVDLYQGKSGNNERDPGVGLGEDVVLKFVGILTNKFPYVKFSFFFDNFFTNPKLIYAINDHGMYGTGTIRENRMSNCPIIKKKELSKKPKGEYVSYVDKNKGIVAVGWNDNNAVFLRSNETGVIPLQQAKRYSVSEKPKISVPQPNVARYNKCMGGVDLLDANVSNYRINIRGKKWYVPIIFWLLDVVMSNAWLVARQHGVSLDALGFRRQCAQALLTKFGSLPLRPGPMRYQDKVSQPARESHNGHLIVKGQPKRRCALCRTVKTTLACQRCNVPLHMRCFEGYHSK